MVLLQPLFLMQIYLSSAGGKREFFKGGKEGEEKRREGREKGRKEREKGRGERGFK